MTTVTDSEAEMNCGLRTSGQQQVAPSIGHILSRTIQPRFERDRAMSKCCRIMAHKLRSTGELSF